jgi:hypothetical protein
VGTKETAFGLAKLVTEYSLQRHLPKRTTLSTVGMRTRNTTGGMRVLQTSLENKGEATEE